MQVLVVWCNTFARLICVNGKVGPVINLTIGLVHDLSLLNGVLCVQILLLSLECTSFNFLEYLLPLDAKREIFSVFL